MDHKDYRLAAIMFTDIVGFSRMMESDEAGTLELMEFHNNLVKGKVQEFKGKVIKTIGDAFLTEFSNAASAAKCAIEIQNTFEAHNREHPEKPIVLRIGVHLGDIYFYENDALGEGINIASRLQSVCTPGRVCISQEVHNLVSNKVGVPIQPLGAVTLKNITRGINAFEILTNGGAEESVPEVKAPTQAPATSSAPSAPTQAPSSKPATSTAAADTGSLRVKIFSEIKSAGRRLSVDEMRGRLSEKGPEIDAYLEKLADSGFLVRVNPAQGTEGNTWSRAAAEDETSDNQNRGHFDSRSHSHSSRERFTQRPGRQYGAEIGDVARDIAHEIKGEIFDRIQNRIEYGGSRKPQNYDEYVASSERKLQKEKVGMKSHLSSYISVNALLWGIWALTGAGFLWPLIVTLAWGIGVVTHRTQFSDRSRELDQMKALPSLNERQFGLLRKLFRERKSWNSHLVSNLSTSVLLIAINLITSPFFPWALFPIGGMLIGLFSRFPAFKHKEKDYLAQLSREGVPIDVLTNRADLKQISQLKYEQGVGPAAKEADQIRMRIMKTLKSGKGKSGLSDDFVPVLDNYVKQIKELSVRDYEIDLLIKSIPNQDLEAELNKLETEAGQTDNVRLKTEYQKSIEQVKKQIRASQEIGADQKVLRLKLNTALNALKQLEMDLARVRGLSAGKEVDAAGFRAKSDELTQYMRDVRQGFQDVDSPNPNDALEKTFQELGKRVEKTQNEQTAPAPAPGIEAPSPDPAMPGWSVDTKTVEKERVLKNEEGPVGSGSA